MRKQLSIFWSAGFISGLLLLLINDHLLKAEFNNSITGKLSDLAGLFIFPLFFSAFLPKYKKHIYWITAIGFIWWKSPLSNTFIHLWNGLEIMNISRMIDWSDLFTLIILPLSYYYLKTYKFPSLSISPLPVIILSSIAFIATTRTRFVDVYYEYKLPYGKEELIRKLNVIAREDKQLPISLHAENANYSQNENGDSMLFYVSKYNEIRDTFYTKEGKIDTVMVHKIPVKDTAYISNDLIYYPMDVKKYFQQKPKDYCNSVIAKLSITGTEHRSTILLLGFDTFNCFGIFDDKSASDEIIKMQNMFEKKLKKK